MRKILGLDLGVASIGWAYILENPEKIEDGTILSLGVRIIPLDTDERDEFAKGGNVPTNQARRKYRGMRRNLQRTHMRKDRLLSVLTETGLMPDPSLLTELSPQKLFSLRQRALHEPLTLSEIGRVLVHLNLRRGYKSNRKDQDEIKDGKKQSDYLEEISKRENILSIENQTIGQHFAKGFDLNPHYRVRQQIFSRASYQSEFDRIWAAQKQFYPNILTDDRYRLLRDKIIYFQRPLRSQKNLVGECALEWNYALDKNGQVIVNSAGKPIIKRPKVAPKSSPLAQICKIWENIHNIRIADENGAQYALTLQQKREIFNVLQEVDKLSATKLLKLLGLSPNIYTPDNLIREKGLDGNRTKYRILQAFQNLQIQRRDLLEFNSSVEEVAIVHPDTGEQFYRKQLSTDFDQQPFYQLWHLLYATEEEQDLIRILQERYQLTSAQAEGLAKLDFTASGYSNKSSRAMRRLLPYLQDGADYAESCRLAGYNHSNSLTNAENDARLLYGKLEVLLKNELRNPVVEKILNQLVHLVNQILVDPSLGPPDEIRIELARELKQSAKERDRTTRRNNQRDRENKELRKRIAEMLHIDSEKVTRVQLEKWRLWHEVGGISLYTGEKTELAAFLRGEGVDVEHIIPRTRYFDDSFENKTICETRFNQEKDKQTARDFMYNQSIKGLQSFDAYLRRVNDLYRQNKNGGMNGEGISKTKFDRLLMTANDIPNDFVDRQLRETQYIARKAKALLSDVCRQVNATSGSVTDFLRHQWGWDEQLHEMRLLQFRAASMTEFISVKKGQQTKEVIKDWTKRLDHRNHALDALTVACTRPAYIQLINNLNQTFEGLVGQDRRDSLHSHGQKTIAKKAPFTPAQVQAALESVLVSFKSGQKVASRSKNKVGGQQTLTPRGPLHEETIYGQVRFYRKLRLNPRFDLGWIEDLVHPHQRDLVEARLKEHDGDPKKAFKNLDKNPITYGKDGIKTLTAVTKWEYTYASRKEISGLTPKQVEKIKSPDVRKVIQQRLDEANGDTKKAFKDLGTNPIHHRGRPIYRVRVENPASKVVELPRGFAEPGGNHHIAIYIDGDGKRHEHVVTFWDAFQRKKQGLPEIITDAAAIYDQIAQSAPDTFSDKLYLPEGYDWKLVTSLKINDMFVFDLDPDEVDFFLPANNRLISRHLFKVQRLSSDQYWFCNHIESLFSVEKSFKDVGRTKWCGLSSMNGLKVHINRLGKITKIGE